jgi:hypothetical protein
MIDNRIFKDYNDLILDTGIYIEYFGPKETELKKILRKELFFEESKITLYGHYLLKSEIFYIICRKIGEKKTFKILNEIDQFIKFVSGEFLYHFAGQIRCRFPIALSDCFSIALSHLHDCPVLFLEEKELSKNIAKEINKEFEVQIFIIS